MTAPQLTADRPTPPDEQATPRLDPRTRRGRRQAVAGAAALALAVAGVVAAVGGDARDGADAAAPAQEPVEGGPAVSSGTDLGYLQSVGDVLVLDRVEWLDHEDLVARAEQQGLDPAEALDFEVVDEQQDLHRYPVSPDAEVTLTVGLAPPDLQGGSVDSSLAELRTLLQDPAVGSAHLFEVTVEDGVVVGIAHRYVS